MGASVGAAGVLAGASATGATVTGAAATGSGVAIGAGGVATVGVVSGVGALWPSLKSRKKPSCFLPPNRFFNMV